MCNVDNYSGILTSTNENRKYYVYRLVDPRTFQTFYVGKGCGDRAVQHVYNVLSLYNKNEDAVSLKQQQIAEIMAAGKQVIIVIHRRGMTEKEAYEVEAALIDCYSGLTNIQEGHDCDRGPITLDDLYTSINTPIYTEPLEKYVIVKITPEVIFANGGSLYNSTRRAWRASLKRAKRYKYVLAVVNSIVREVYEVEDWYQDTPTRIAFTGKPTTDSISSLKRKRIPNCYRKIGNANPFIYKK